QGKFIVKERASEEGRDALVALDTHRPTSAGTAWDGAFEESVSEAAGLALRLLTRGSRVGLLLGDFVVPPGSGPAHRRGLLRALALVEPVRGPLRPPAVVPGSVAVYRAGRGPERAA
ncbi:MAG: DUF58 domain-containing protein, partial [Thermoanaerobaculia bacterium]|nr:DUF58 domain-containing protein [Thermoanaerobaculia bacterium]